MFRFNLIDEEWIPCIMSDGSLVHSGLADVLLKAREIKEISDQNPLATAALHRLLLAILHRNFGPASESEWAKLWNEGKGNWDTGKLREYINRWHGRFDLFDNTYPFYQSSRMPTSSVDAKGKEKSYIKSVANLAHELSTGNNATLFDHTSESNTRPIAPDEAARLLVAFQAFAVGGLLTFETGQDPKRFKSADNAPLVKGAVTLARGKNLFQTLMLNLHKYNHSDEEPFKMSLEDTPAWERDEDTVAEDRQPRGYLDLLTWQSRRLKLVPEDIDGKTFVHQVVVMKGNQFPDDYSLYGKDPMLAFRKVKKPGKGQDPWPPVTFRENRALWRDSLSLFQSVKEEQARPKMMDWLTDLSVGGVIQQSATYDLAVMGLTTSKASILMWRHERMPLPLKYLEDEELVSKLKDALDLAEEVGKDMNSSAWNLARLSIAPEKASGERLSDSQKKNVDDFADSLSFSRPYWVALGLHFNRLVAELPEDKSAEGEYGGDAMPRWARQVREAARQAFREATDGLDHSGRWLRAVSIAEDNFSLRLGTIVRKFLEPYQK